MRLLKFSSRYVCFLREITSKMGSDYNEHVGHHDGIHNASLFMPNYDADGQACKSRFERGWKAGSLSRDGDDDVAGVFYQQDLLWAATNARQSVHLGRGDTRDGVVGVLLRLHHHAHTRWRVSTKIWRQIHPGLHFILYVHVNITDTHCGAHGADLLNGFTFHWRTRRSNNTLIIINLFLKFLKRVLIPFPIGTKNCIYFLYVYQAITQFLTNIYFIPAHYAGHN